jgi:hypothetical protein
MINYIQQHNIQRSGVRTSITVNAVIKILKCLHLFFYFMYIIYYYNINVMLIEYCLFIMKYSFVHRLCTLKTYTVTRTDTDANPTCMLPKIKNPNNKNQQQQQQQQHVFCCTITTKLVV